MTAKIKTVRRTKDMPPGVHWRLTFDGKKYDYTLQPTERLGFTRAQLRTLRRIVDDDEIAEPLTPPQVRFLEDRVSLRRIVDRDPPKRKRKMVRLYYFRDVHGLYSSFNRQEIDGLHDVRYQPGRIESVLIPEPRKKAGR